MDSYPFKFSIVIAVYNVAPFLSEAIESLIQQDINFQQNVEVILVDDGSNDGSGDICDRYHRSYPDNITVIHQDNRGVSAARNEGLKYITGEYVNFLDGDDKLSSNTFSCVYRYFKSWPAIPMIAIPLRFFDGRTGEHGLNYKFAKGSRIIDLLEEYQNPQLSLSSAFIKNQLARTINFDERLVTAEDAKVILQLLLMNPRYGVVQEPTYWYRRRTSGEASAIQQSHHTRAWYTNYMEYFAKWVVRSAQTADGQIPQFAQYTLMYDLQWRFKTEESPAAILNETEQREYFKTLRDTIRCIDDTIILEQKSLTTEYKLYILKEKYGCDPYSQKTDNDVFYYIKDRLVYQQSMKPIRIEFITFSDGALRIEAKYTHFCIADEPSNWLFKVNDRFYECKSAERSQNFVSQGKRIGFERGFSCVIPLDKKETYTITLYCYIGGLYVEQQHINFGKFSPLQKTIWSSYYASGDFILTYRNNQLQLNPYTYSSHLYRELSYLKALWKHKDIAAKKAVILRIAYYLRKILPAPETWLISDRINKADDNGEAFFKYLSEHHRRKLRFYFAISPGVTDYHRLKSYGKVIPFKGWKYKWLYLCGAKIISSQGEDYVYRPFQKNTVYYSDLIQANRFVFLQHGIIKDDLSRWLNRYSKNIHMFVTTTKPEWQSVLNYKYFYDEQVVKLTGLPRHDYLYHDEKKIITIMPSWRAYLVTPVHPDGSRTAISGFRESSYYKMYQKLLSDNKLIKNAQIYGYKLQLLFHPSMVCTLPAFHFDASIEVLTDHVSYRKVFAESALIITDYSSAVFDFAILRKPVLYYHADKEEFFSGAHTYDKGYFNYEQDGFGEVSYTQTQMIDTIIEYMKNGCLLKEQYKKRIDNTFLFSDHNNCKRVYKNILMLK